MYLPRSGLSGALLMMYMLDRAGEDRKNTGRQAIRHLELELELHGYTLDEVVYKTLHHKRGNTYTLPQVSFAVCVFQTST